jgi:hypothetical protein
MFSYFKYMNENGFHDHGIYEWGIQTPARHHRIKSYIKYPLLFSLITFIRKILVKRLNRPSCLANFITKNRIYLQSARMNFTMNLGKKNEKFHILEFGSLFAHFPKWNRSFLYWLINNSYLTGGYCPLTSRFWLSYLRMIFMIMEYMNGEFKLQRGTIVSNLTLSTPFFSH